MDFLYFDVDSVLIYVHLIFMLTYDEENFAIREGYYRGVAITSVFDEDPSCLVGGGGGGGGYTRHQLSDEPHKRNALALKFNMSYKYSVCKKLALLVKQSKGV